MTKQIQLSRGLTAVVCDCHAHLVADQHWLAYPSGMANSFYAKAYAGRKNGKQLPLEHMHRTIAGAVAGEIVDHINHNTLDNRCSNLRVCSHSENHRNQNTRSDNRSGLKGVRAMGQKWQARINVSGKTKQIGLFLTAQDAASAYDKEAKKHFGQFARTNFL